MATDGSDWAVPKAVLARPDGDNAYDVSTYLCDKDPDTVADLGNLLANGDLLICLDVPKVSGLKLDVGTPNQGQPTQNQLYSSKLTFDALSKVTRPDVKATITTWVQDSGATGHFTDGASPVSIGSGNTNVDVIEGMQVIIGSRTVQLSGSQATGLDQER